MKELLKKLVQANSTLSSGELQTAKLIAEAFKDFGVEAAVDCWDDNRANVIAHIKSTGQKPALLFACHLDVVPPGESPWQKPPFSGIEEDGKVHGRGSCDMKGGTVAAIAAIKEILESDTKRALPKLARLSRRLRPRA